MSNIVPIANAVWCNYTPLPCIIAVMLTSVIGYINCFLQKLVAQPSRFMENFFPRMSITGTAALTVELKDGQQQAH